MPKKGFKTITITEDVYHRINGVIDRINEKAGYKKFRSVAHFVEESIMQFDLPDLIPLEHFNLHEDGIRVLDRTLGTKRSRGRIIDVIFKPDKVWCDYCESDDCRHTQFALSLPEVQSILRKKGWKLAKDEEA